MGAHADGVGTIEPLGVAPTAGDYDVDYDAGTMVPPPLRAPPLSSQHHLPTRGNWVRLSAGQQYDVTRRLETARRRDAGGFQSFGNEPRLSASRRWAHQTTSGRCAETGGRSIPSAHAAGAASSAGGGAGAGKRPSMAGPGSFLPLKACASMLHVPVAARPRIHHVHNQLGRVPMAEVVVEDETNQC
jgi:hypothetical protein